MKKLNLLFSLLIINPLLAQVQLGGDIDGEYPGDESATAVSLSSDGTIVAVGAYFNDDNGSNAGHVRVYEYNSGSWTQLGSDIDGEAENDHSGVSVALSADGTIVAIGAYLNNNIAGQVRVYEYINGSWTQLGGDIHGEAAYDESGYSVSISSYGTIVAVGAPYNDGNGPGSGHVRVYEYNSGSWTQLGSDIDGEAHNDLSGMSVALSADGTIVAIGEPGYDGSDTCIGRVRVYEFINGSWTQLGGGIDGETAYDYSGNSVSLSSDGNIIAIGTYFNDGDDTINSQRGHVRVYQYSNGNWTQLGLDIDGEAAEDLSGAVSLSSDGTILAIGALYNDGNDTIDYDRGHVRVYEYNSGSWTQLGSDIDGEASYDYSGGSVSLSSDGTIVAIGATGNDGNGNDAGHVRVYSIGGNTAGINPTTLEYNLQIYPNPTNDYLILDIPVEMIGQQYSFVITNAAGQSLHSDFLNQEQLQINLKNFASSGTHTLQIKDSGGNVVDTRVIILQ